MRTIIRIDMDKKCRRCGKKGVGEGGLCIGCVADGVKAGEFDHIIKPLGAERLKAMSNDEEKIKGEYHLECPHCKKGIIVEVVRQTLSEPVPGEYNEFAKTKADPQGKLFAGGDPGAKASKAKKPKAKKAKKPKHPFGF